MKKIFFTAVALTATLHADLNTTDHEAYRYMNQLALESGADKGSHFHNYTEVYSQFFHSIKDLPIKFLEIGLDTGKSVRMWENYFKNAELHFIDITYERLQYFSKKSYYHLVDQQSRADLEKFIQKYGDFDIILDDGGHTMEQQIVSFCTLFPHIKKGGLYIIEDLHTSYWSNWPNGANFDGGKRSGTTIEFLKGLIDEVNYVGAKTYRANHRNLSPELLNGLNIYQRDIESMHFYDSTVIIKKRD